MLLSDIFTHLEQGELAHLSLGASGTLDASEYPLIGSHLNLALLQIYTRFPLKQNQALIQQQAGRTLYPLKQEFARSRNAVGGFILDSFESPFLGDVIKIEQVVTPDGTYLPLNDETVDISVYTPSPSTLQIPNPEGGELLAVLYRATHPAITLTPTSDPSSIELELPIALLEPLLLYVAARIVRSRSTAESMSEANALMSQYEMQLAQLSQAGLLQGTQSVNTRLERNGWL